MKKSVAIGTWPTPERTVRITVPAKVAWDLDRFTRALGNLAERLGCDPCVSGVNCEFVRARDFVVDADSRVQSVEGGIIIDG